jgi:uncharacterized protein (DUF305 family)
MNRRYRLTAAATLVLVTVAGCGGGGSPDSRQGPSTQPAAAPSSASPSSRAQDMLLAEALLHARGDTVVLTAQAPAPTLRRDIGQLAAGIGAACQRDVQDLTEWLRVRGRTPTGSGDGRSSRPPSALGRPNGPGSDRALLLAMADVQRKAMRLANQIQHGATDGQLIQVARRVVASGTAVLVEIERLLRAPEVR